MPTYRESIQAEREQLLAAGDKLDAATVDAVLFRVARIAQFAEREHAIDCLQDTEDVYEANTKLCAVASVTLLDDDDQRSG